MGEAGDFLKVAQRFFLKNTPNICRELAWIFFWVKQEKHLWFVVIQSYTCLAISTLWKSSTGTCINDNQS